jgi:hypothetical protein
MWRENPWYAHQPRRLRPAGPRPDQSPDRYNAPADLPVGTNRGSLQCGRPCADRLNSQCYFASLAARGGVLQPTCTDTPERLVECRLMEMMRSHQAGLRAASAAVSHLDPFWRTATGA